MATIITLLVVGTALIIAEILLPGMIAGILGAICLAAAVILGYVNYGPTTGTLIFGGVCLGLTIGAVFWIRYFPGSRVARIFISKGAIGEMRVEQPELVGQTGIAHTDLRPSGVAMINGQRYDVVTEGALIERGDSVKVVDTEGMRIVVRKV